MHAVTPTLLKELLALRVEKISTSLPTEIIEVIHDWGHLFTFIITCSEVCDQEGFNYHCNTSTVFMCQSFLIEP